MAVAAFYSWDKLGRPLEPAQPIRDVVARLKVAFPRAAAANLFGWYADERHYEAVPAEDHTPFSQTGWPLPNPQWVVFATDVMHRPDLGVNCNVLFPYWLGEAKAGRMPWLKYLIWQAKIYDVRNGWVPKPNSDHVDHIHLSTRTDFRTVGLGDWDLIPGGNMELSDKLTAYGLDASFGGAIVTIYRRTGFLANDLGLAARLDAILAAANNDGQSTVTMSDADRAVLVGQLSDGIADEFSSRLAQ